MQLIQQGVTGAHRLGRGHIEKRKAFDVAEAKRLHAQDHVRQIRTLNLRLRELGSFVVILLRIQPDAHPFGHAARATFALIGTGLGHRFDRQAAGARLRRITTHPRKSGINDITDPGQRERSLRDIGRHNHPAAGRGGKDPLLASQPVDGFADIPLGGHKHEHIPTRGRAQNPSRRFDRSVDVVQGFPFFLFFGFLRALAKFIERLIDDFDRKRAARHLDHRRIIKRLAKGRRINGGRSDDDPQIRSLVPELAEMPEQEIDVEGTFVRLVDDDRIVFAQLRVGLHLGEQHAVGHEFDRRGAGCTVFKTHLAADLPAPAHVHFLGHASRNRECRDPARLGAGNTNGAAPARRQA